MADFVTALAVTDDGIKSIPPIVPLAGRAAFILAAVQRSERVAALAAEAASPATTAQDDWCILVERRMKVTTKVHQACMEEYEMGNG